MGAPREIRKKYKEGKLGTFEYGEGEYLHNCEPIWTDITCGERDHWRNNMSAFFYCTHSAGPLIHITGMRPAKVTGFECPFNTRMARMGARAGHTAIEMVTFEDGSDIQEHPWRRTLEELNLVYGLRLGGQNGIREGGRRGGRRLARLREHRRRGHCELHR